MINYPNGKKFQSDKSINYARRGMSLEEDLNDTNKYYLENDIAAIYKKPTPITVVNVEYKSRSTAKITEAYFQVPSTTDYNGIYKGKYLDFEAKETKSKTSLVLSIFHPHQLTHLRRVERYGGIGFVIIRFSELDQTFLVYASKLFSYIDNTAKKSIPYKWFLENGTMIPYRYQKKVDYLNEIDKYLLEEKQ
ncbi:MAG: Holliday junction resolvase RecU [Erysipelotrichia bacterium]|nr:Holliday junction resolvase RecU [Erysipelotrichia bacterium]